MLNREEYEAEKIAKNGINAELTTTDDYEYMILQLEEMYEQTGDERYKNAAEAIKDINREELVHAGEFSQILANLNPENGKAVEEGMKEVREMGTENITKDAVGYKEADVNEPINPMCDEETLDKEEFEIDINDGFDKNLPKYYSTMNNKYFTITGLPRNRIKIDYEDGSTEEKKESYFKELLSTGLYKKVSDSSIKDEEIDLAKYTDNPDTKIEGNKVVLSNDDQFNVDLIDALKDAGYREKNSYTYVKDELIESGSEEAFQKNIATEIKAGKDPKQAAAIAYSVQRENDAEIKDTDLIEGKTYTSKSGNKLTVKKVTASYSDYNGEPGIKIKYDYETTDGQKGSSECSTRDFFAMMKDSSSIKDSDPEISEAIDLTKQCEEARRKAWNSDKTYKNLLREAFIKSGNKSSSPYITGKKAEQIYREWDTLSAISKMKELGADTREIEKINKEWGEQYADIRRLDKILKEKLSKLENKYKTKFQNTNIYSSADVPRLRKELNELNKLKKDSQSVKDEASVNDTSRIALGNKYYWEEKYADRTLTITKIKKDKIRLELNNNTYVIIPTDKFYTMLDEGTVTPVSTVDISEYNGIQTERQYRVRNGNKTFIVFATSEKDAMNKIKNKK